ncbi:hypothetical protein BDQ17DRAFT_1437379 [Cyathus striatus]|nr:hypothetical protein BDQ17DRAFT_1437379 [Cyathus striatus]
MGWGNERDGGDDTPEELSSSEQLSCLSGSSISAGVEISPTLVCSIRWLESSPEGGVAAVPALEVQRIYGCERARFESYNAPAFRIGASVIRRDLYTETTKHILVVIGSEGETVGWGGGYIQGGGHSPLSNVYGMAADHIPSFEVVLSNGRFVTADATQNTDVFCALRGGGGSTFGVVISTIAKAYPAPPSPSPGSSSSPPHAMYPMSMTISEPSSGEDRIPEGSCGQAQRKTCLPALPPRQLDRRSKVQRNIQRHPHASQLRRHINSHWRDNVLHAITHVKWDESVQDLAAIRALQEKFSTNTTQAWKDVSPGAGSYPNEAGINKPNWQDSSVCIGSVRLVLCPYCCWERGLDCGCE